MSNFAGSTATHSAEFLITRDYSMFNAAQIMKLPRAERLCLWWLVDRFERAQDVL